MRNKQDVYKVTTLVGFIGKNNVGKTHILNQLIGSNYQSHYYCSTKGICFKLPIKQSLYRNTILIDSAGSEKPIQFNIGGKNEGFEID